MDTWHCWAEFTFCACASLHALCFFCTNVTPFIYLLCTFSPLNSGWWLSTRGRYPLLHIPVAAALPCQYFDIPPTSFHFLELRKKNLSIEPAPSPLHSTTVYAPAGTSSQAASMASYIILSCKIRSGTCCSPPPDILLNNFISASTASSLPHILRSDGGMDPAALIFFTCLPPCANAIKLEKSSLTWHMA